MADVRDLLAVGLGLLLGLVLLAAPRAAFHLSVAGGPQNRRGEYGADGDVPARYRWLIRALGLVCLVIAGVIGYQTFL
ncbi:hypothetical protein [Halolamina sp.]|jgi:hypothetical protein|uniref:hypothetical protein n=1 Tax=Halolamina sp. TaxID=1940283 RepID=UPI000223B481|nr:hypothetical protein Halar_1592 [halophilic archaeon DL31]